MKSLNLLREAIATRVEAIAIRLEEPQPVFALVFGSSQVRFIAKSAVTCEAKLLSATRFSKRRGFASFTSFFTCGRVDLLEFWSKLRQERSTKGRC